MIEIYKHTCIISGKAYVGLTKHGINKRWKSHCRDAKRGSDKHFHLAIIKYGEDAWTHEKLAECSDLASANRAEISCIDYYDTYENGYNLTIGGGGVEGYKHSREALQKISHNSSGVNNPMYGSTGGFLGGIHTKESRLKISKATKGRIVTPLMRSNHSKIMKSKPLIKCPHCSFENNNAGAMTRHHFDNCKKK